MQKAGDREIVDFSQIWKVSLRVAHSQLNLRQYYKEDY